MTRLLVLPLAIFAFFVGVQDRADASIPACESNAAIVWSETNPNVGPQCNPDGDNTLHLYMSKRVIHGETWQERCNDYGGFPDTYRVGRKLVRMCYNVDF